MTFYEDLARSPELLARLSGLLGRHEEKAPYMGNARCEGHVEELSTICPENEDAVVNDSIREAYAEGLLLFRNCRCRVEGVLCAHSLLPQVFPRDQYAELSVLSERFSEVYDKISCDLQWLLQKLSGAIETDPCFVGKLANIAVSVYGNKDLGSQLRLLLTRSDYMLHERSFKIEGALQVEVNTISVGISFLSSVVGNIHRNQLRNLMNRKEIHHEDLSQRCPSFDVANVVASPIFEACRLYLDCYDTVKQEIAVLVIVEENETNEVDQFGTLKQLREMGPNGTLVIWHSFDYLVKAMQHGILFVDENEAMSLRKPSIVSETYRDYEIAVVYWRTAYSPTAYVTQDHWKVRALIERSRAVKVPSVLQQLSGMKPIQAVLSDRNELKRFVKDESILDRMMRVTARQGDPLRNPDMVEDARKNPENWVLKPSREGGGNNLYGCDVPLMLESILKSEASASSSSWVLMEKIESPNYPMVFICPSKDSVRIMNVKATSEIGFFCTHLSEKGTTVILENSGYLLRSKQTAVHECGIHAGCGAVNSVFLV